MSYPRTEVVYQRRTNASPETWGPEVVITNPVKGAAIQPADWQATDDEVVYQVWIRTHLSGSSVHDSEKTPITLYSAASGGTVTTFTGNGSNGTDGVQYRVHTFTGNGNFVVRYPRTVDHLIVAGGGGGGSRHGGGGGGGGVLSGSGSRAAATYAVTVGTGGKGRDKSTDTTTSALNAASGGDSTAFGLTATGGGRGGSGGGGRGSAGSGGSGGGSESFSTGAAGTSGQGNTGGTGQGDPNWSGGGGGGAGAVGGNSSGTNASRNVSGGAGGAGTASWITGTEVSYGGGGGGSMEHRHRGTAGGASAGGGAGGHSFWEVFNLRGILRWELYATSGNNPTTQAGFDTMITNATRTGVGYASIGTSNRNKNGVSETLLDWNSVAQLRTITGANVGASNSGNNFALVVTGRFWPTHTDTYHFELQSDDSADIRIGNTTVASYYGSRGLNDSGTVTSSISLTAGLPYTFRVRQQDGDGNEGLRVFWYRNGDTTRRQEGGQIGPGHPENGDEFDSLMQRMDANGPVASGTNEITTQTAVTNSANALNWTDTNRSTVFSGVTFPNSGKDFAYMLHGTFVPRETGTYTFTVAGDDAVDVWINTTFVTAHYGGHGVSALGTHTGTISLTAGQAYLFRVRQEQGDGSDGLRVFWRKPSQSASSDWFQDSSELSGIGRNGTDGLGGGGGGGGHSWTGGSSTNFDGGRGGSGVVIVRYPARIAPGS